MDYKDTLNLPRTDFAMKADLVTREPERLRHWQATDLYGKILARRAGAPRFILHDGPPFANGDVHIGTALNKILKDIIIKQKALRGYNSPYVPGWDCHGLPIEFKVTQEMRKAASSGAGAPPANSPAGASPADKLSDPATIRKACEDYARKYIGIQREQFKRLGVLGDWDNPYLTLNKDYEANELRLFADLVEQGFVYRGKKPVYWSIPCRTALAEAEVEYQDHVSQSCFVKFPVVDRPGTFIVIWTTTPWTLPANLAVAYNSTFSYSLVRVGVGEDKCEDYIISALLVSTVAQKCGWEGYQIVRSLDGDHLAGTEYQHPFCDRTGKLFPGDSFVTNDTGTGFVHIAPGHGMDDYHLGLAQGLPIYSPVDDDGRFAHTSDLPVTQQMPAEMLGKSILEKHGKSDANEAVLHELRVRQALLHQENYHHSYPHCWRSKTPIIFRAMDQWFIRIDLECGDLSPLSRAGDLSPAAARQVAPQESADESAHSKTFRQRALEEINRVAWVPDWGKNRIEAAVKSRPDWCISRQRTWGVPIPAFYDAQGNALLDARIVRNVAALIEQHGSNVWFEKPAADLWALVKPADWTAPEAATKSADTLDVWIDSGSSSRCVIAQRAELRGDQSTDPASGMPYPAFQCDLYLEGSDQHRGWFQSSLLLSLAGNGAAPYRAVLTHGFMVDADREKISKSKQGQGGYDKPQTADAYVKKWGVDVVRLWVASQDFRSDIVVSEERISKVSETYRGIRNALRYQLSNLYDFDPAQHTVPAAQLTGLDRWVLGEFANLEADVAAAYDRHEFHVVYQRLAQFIAVELSSIYHDVIKDRLYTDPANSPRRRSTQTALHRLVTDLCKMLSPILVFTADEAWQFIPGQPAESVHLADWEPSDGSMHGEQREEIKDLLTFRNLVVLPKLEQARQSKSIGKALDAAVTIRTNDPTMNMRLQIAETHARGCAEAFREILGVSHLEVMGLPTSTRHETIIDEVTVVSAATTGRKKCERCWHWETDVGQHAAHPTLCGRCVQAVTQLETLRS
jgi:isoleucyl-tRNA synthetase